MVRIVHITDMRLTRLALTLAAAFAVLSPAALAQKPGTKYREFPALGFKFKPLAEWFDVPIQPDEADLGIIAQMNAERGVYVKVEGNDRPMFTPGLLVVKVEPPKAVTEGSSGGDGLRGDVGREKGKEEGVKDFVLRYAASGIRETEFAELETETESVKILKELTLRHEIVTTYQVFSSGIGLDVVYDYWVLPLNGGTIHFLWEYPAQTRKDWQKAVEKAMKSLRLGDAEEVEVSSVDENSSYEDFMKYHRSEVAQTPGWKLIETPSKRFAIKTNVENPKKTNDVIKRLEASRDLFEEDFPPPSPITAVSIVRICATEDEFHKYGKTGTGVAGWFNPRTTELVLYFDADRGEEFTSAVMTHEGFHQYCHFLFHEAEAHRWFDEGHGDYYGGFDLVSGRLKADAKMPEGLDRTSFIKQMISEGTVKPLSTHLRFNHRQWQEQGPEGVSCYSQSWSIIWFLRQGARGKVSSKYWKKEYAQIIPEYMRVLSEEYKIALEELRQEKLKILEDLKDTQGDQAEIHKMEEFIRSMELDDQRRQEIWDKAMAESWGKIDEYVFEERWKNFVMDQV
jgi:hypothetical protein